MGVAVIFGGTGFIGTHLAQHLSRQSPSQAVVLVDLKEPRNESYTGALQEGLASKQIRYVRHDARTAIPADLCDEAVDIVYNLAAIHREPGHQAEEYFETNIKAAETVCAWASHHGCKRMVFVSSISPYGPSEEPKTELSTPTPETPYGSSKLMAETIHKEWQSAQADRQLLILRPGVVFGPGEGGNVTRLLRSLVRGYFVYMGNQATKKAASYVKELGWIVEFGLGCIVRDQLGMLLLNVTLDPSPTVEDFVKAIQKVGGLRRPLPNIPRTLLVAGSYPVDAIAKVFRIKQPINPVRMRKMFRSTNVEALALRQLGYKYHYVLEAAFEDWKADAPQDFVR